MVSHRPMRAARQELERRLPKVFRARNRSESARLIEKKVSTPAHKTLFLELHTACADMSAIQQSEVQCTRRLLSQALRHGGAKKLRYRSSFASQAAVEHQVGEKVLQV